MLPAINKQHTHIDNACIIVNSVAKCPQAPNQNNTSTDANRFFTGKKRFFLPVKNLLPFLLVKYKFYQLISETKITLKK